MLINNLNKIIIIKCVISKLIRLCTRLKKFFGPKVRVYSNVEKIFFTLGWSQRTPIAESSR